jgi:hypothetical protein
MEITFTLTPQDVVAFNRHQFQTSPSLQRSYRMGYAWGVLAAAAVYLVLGAWANPWNAVFPVLFLIVYLTAVHCVLQSQDKYHFMERMVTDSQVTHVLVICDKQYAEKADARKDGVGTESQIISKEVYDKVEQ